MDTRKYLPKSSSGQDLCVYCLALADTKDHTPPQFLLRSSRPAGTNWITVPACQKCNHEFSFDERIVGTVISLLGSHPDLVCARNPGGTVFKALAKDTRLRTVIAQHQRSDGGITLEGEMLRAFERVFGKAVQGLYFGLYSRFLPREDVRLISIHDHRSTTRQNLVDDTRPNGLIDITDSPLPAITSGSWPVHEPVITMNLERILSDGTREPTQRIFRLVRETPVQWITYEPEVFSFAFVENEQGEAVVFSICGLFFLCV